MWVNNTLGLRATCCIGVLDELKSVVCIAVKCSNKLFHKLESKAGQILQKHVPPCCNMHVVTVDNCDSASRGATVCAGCSERRGRLPGGYRSLQWILVDEHDRPRTAVKGKEREKGSGSYSYSACEPFATLVPMQARPHFA